ncbi:MAG TPA: CDP-glycerol glycerophosphotransferase family protein [Candidatus Anaerobutyricum faecale]|nr:CDP-glycerol glycerophosphotransferase family protein [Candidatus Anaerobutyricum faecale]
MGENILMVYSKSSTVKCALATASGAPLRLVDRVNETLSASLSRGGLDIQWFGGIINRMNSEISDVYIQIGSRMRQPFDIPITSENISLKKKDPKYIRNIHFDLSELIKNHGEINSRICISLKINGQTTEFPVKTFSLIDEKNRYSHVPITCFYADDHAVQLRFSTKGNLVFVCRPMEKVEYSRWFRFWESPLVSGFLYRLGRFIKSHSSRKVAVFYEKFCEKAEEGAYDIFLEARKDHPGNVYFLINQHAPDYQKIKHTPHVVRQYSIKYYWLLEPSYMIVNSDKEQQVIHNMLGIHNSHILKTGMAIFSKIPYKHLTQDSDDIAVIMLTWKPYEEMEEDFTKTSYYKNTVGIYEILRRYLSADQIKIVIHPKTNGHLENTPLASSIWTRPISEVLSIAKLLITDYSSVCYNSFYQGGGVVFFQEDLDLYESENGKLIPADDEYIGQRAFSFEELESILEDGLDHGRILLDHFRTPEFERRYQTINEFSDGRNIERICDSLRELKVL